MGVSGSSSKRKPSKRKSDKVSSKRKKGKRKESKKRRREYDSVSSYSDDESFNSDISLTPIPKSDSKRRVKKSKKRRRRDYSASSYSDGYSTSSDSDSLPSNDKGKSGKRKRLKISSKGTKKKTRKRFTSSESDEDAHRVRKRKRSTKDPIKPKKKSLKKKSKKHVSSSSSSDDSNPDVEHQRSKKLVNKEIESPIGRESRKGHRKNKIRSPRCSSLSISDDHNVSVGLNDEALAPVNNSRRLRSVIIIVNHSDEEGDKWEKDPQKEEIVYDHDDYPSPRSLDSNEGEIKRETNNDSQVASDERMMVEHVASEEITEPRKSRINGGNKNNDGNNQPGGAHIEKEKEMEVSVGAAALGEDDLESILRQKALENLRKFKVRRQTEPSNTGNLIENEVKGSSSKRADITLNKSTKQDIPNIQEVNPRSGLAIESGFSRTTEVKKQPEGDHFEKEPKIAKHIAPRSPDQKALVGCSKQDSTSSKAVLAEAISESDISLGAEVINPGESSIIEPTSSDAPISEEQILEKQQSEAKDGSEFEQKTMSVMRGGEMVQVSYKVYIPKRAATLGRRLLKR